MSSLNRFFTDEKGAFTIEFVLWVPIILVLLAIVIDATTIYVVHTEMWNVARDTARRVAMGKITSEDAAEQHAVDSMNLRDFPYYVDVEYDKAGGGDIEVIIALNVKDIAILGYGSPLALIAGDMMARVEMRPVPRFDWTPSGP